MSKIVLTDEELNFLKSAVDIENKSKETVLIDFSKYCRLMLNLKGDSEEDSIARSIMKKLCCITDKEWKKVK